jgi:hypothetical protein
MLLLHHMCRPCLFKKLSAISAILLACHPDIQRFDQHTRLAAAAADAMSGFPETLLWAARGRLLIALRGAPLAARLTAVALGTPWTVEWRRGPFTGELLGISRLVFMAVPFLMLVTGGSGRGRTRPCGVWAGANRFIGDERPVFPFIGRDLDDFLTPVTNSWSMASSGFIRRSGSHRRHRAMKSRNASSSHLSACCNVFELGRLRRPLVDTVTLGFPSESKNNFFLLLFSIRCFSGGPKISMMQASCSCSFSPGKIG